MRNETEQALLPYIFVAAGGNRLRRENSSDTHLLCNREKKPISRKFQKNHTKIPTENHVGGRAPRRGSTSLSRPHNCRIRLLSSRRAAVSGFSAIAARLPDLVPPPEFSSRIEPLPADASSIDNEIYSDPALSRTWHQHETSSDFATYAHSLANCAKTLTLLRFSWW